MNRNVIECCDCAEGLCRLGEGIADCCVTDPPYGIRFMGKAWDYEIPPVSIWREVLRVLKPGAHALVACGTRTQHRMAVNIEDAGFEVRDVICWHYGQGFPKSMDISKAIDKQAGVERRVVGMSNNTYDGALRNPLKHKSPAESSNIGEWGLNKSPHGLPLTAPETEEAKRWAGWGTALKPATEFWTLVRKPIDAGTVAENVRRHGTGALNIDECRIPTQDSLGGGSEKRPTFKGKEGWDRPWMHDADGSEEQAEWVRAKVKMAEELGRYPSNLILDEFMAGEMDRQSGELTSGKPAGIRKAVNKVYGPYAPGQPVTGYGDSGGGSRFFYVAKADPEERGAGNNHPTVKPLALIHYLLRLICPIEPGRCMLDPFAGSGSHCIAARQLGLDYIAFERDPENVRMAGVRMREKLGLFC